MWKTSWGLACWKTHDNPTTSTTTYDGIEKAFLAKEWNVGFFLWPLSPQDLKYI